MNSVQTEIRKFQSEVEREIVRIIRAGEAAPFDAAAIARQRVLERRQQSAAEGTGGGE